MHLHEEVPVETRREVLHEAVPVKIRREMLHEAVPVESRTVFLCFFCTYRDDVIVMSSLCRGIMRKREYRVCSQKTIST